jgi:hypothetical protein
LGQKFEILSIQNDLMKTRHYFWSLALRMKKKEHRLMLMLDGDAGGKDEEVVNELDCFQKDLSSKMMMNLFAQRKVVFA